MKWISGEWQSILSSVVYQRIVILFLLPIVRLVSWNLSISWLNFYILEKILSSFDAFLDPCGTIFEQKKRWGIGSSHSIATRIHVSRAGKTASHGRCGKFPCLGRALFPKRNPWDGCVATFPMKLSQFTGKRSLTWGVKLIVCWYPIRQNEHPIPQLLPRLESSNAPDFLFILKKSQNFCK